MQWASDAKQPGWWQPFSIEVATDLDLYISLEAEARSVDTYSLPINGLLQTEEYARAILARAVPQATSSELDTLVQVRTGRRIVLDPDRGDAPPLELHAVLDESALRRGPSTGAVMPNQLTELLNRSEQDNITLQVLPFSAGYTSADSTFAIFDPRRTDDWAVVNVESTGADAYRIYLSVLVDTREVSVVRTPATKTPHPFDANERTGPSGTRDERTDTSSAPNATATHPPE